MVPSLSGLLLAHPRPDQRFCLYPMGRDEDRILARLAAESPRCALAQDPEVGAGELRCPQCNARGAWQDEQTADKLVEAPDDAVDREPYQGRRRAAVAGVWRCRRGHETKEPVRPRREPRGTRGRAKQPPAGRNARENQLISLCDCQ